MDEINVHIGKAIQAAREGNNINQQMLADLLGLSRTSIANIESGRHGTTPQNLYVIASLFSISVSDLFPPLKLIEYEITTEMVEVKRMKAVKKAIITESAPDTDK